MRATIPTLVALLCAVHAVADDATNVNEATLSFTYVVKAAPVWTADGTFDPAVLIKLIETTSEQDSLRVHQFPKSGALSITTTIAAHDQIWKLLKQFPTIAVAWGPGDPDYRALLKEQELRVERNRKLNRWSEQLERDRLKTLRKHNCIDVVSDPLNEVP